MTRRRRLRTGLGVLTLAVLALAAFLALPPPREPLVVAPDGSDANACSTEHPCASLDGAYRQALPGEKIEVAGGVYGPQTIVRRTANTGAGRVVIRPHRRERVVLEGLELGRADEPSSGPSDLTVDGMTVAGRDGRQRPVVAHPGTHDVLLADIDASNFYLNGVHDLTVRGGDWGPCTATTDPTGCANSKIDGSPINDDITIEDAVFHDYRIVPGSDAHFECLIVFGGTDIAIRRNRFVDCEFYDIFVQHSSTYRMDGMRIENNWFDVPWDGQNRQNRPAAVAFSPRGRRFHDVLIRSNSFLDAGLHINEDGDGTRYSRFRVTGNVGGVSECSSSVAYRANVWLGAACDPSDRTMDVGDLDRRERPPGRGRDGGSGEQR